MAGLCTYRSARGLCALPPQCGKELCTHHECPVCLGTKSSRQTKCDDCEEDALMPAGLLEEVSVMLAAIGHQAVDALKAAGPLFSFADHTFVVAGLSEGQLTFRSSTEPSKFIWQHIDGQVFYYYEDGPHVPAAQCTSQRLHRLPPLGKKWLMCTPSPTKTIGDITLGSGRTGNRLMLSIAYHVATLEKFRGICEEIILDEKRGDLERALEAATTADDALAALRRIPPSFFYRFSEHVKLSPKCAESLQLKFSEFLLRKVAAHRREYVLTCSPDLESPIEKASTLLKDVKPIDDLMVEFVDSPIEVAREYLQDTLPALRTPELLIGTVIGGAETAYRTLVEAELDSVRKSSAVRDTIVNAVTLALDTDRAACLAAFDLLKAENAHDTSILLNMAATDSLRIREKHPERPLQPLSTIPCTSILHLKVHAARAARMFFEWVEDDLRERTPVRLYVPSTIGKTCHLIQKLIFRESLETVCDTLRTLATVKNIAQLRQVHQFLMDCERIDILNLEDHVNYPTRVGWVGLVYHLRVRPVKTVDDRPSYMSPSGLRQASAATLEREQQANGHVCEVKVALEPVLAARTVLRNADSRARAEHLLALLRRIGDPISTDLETEPLKQEPTTQTDLLIAMLHRQVAERDERIARLLQKNAELQRQIEEGSLNKVS